MVNALLETARRDPTTTLAVRTQLFISSKTVEYHLHKAFTKLGIRSRHQLDRALRRDGGS
jgi:DNA-binding NarL/FixJ family response regulator